MPYTSPPIDFPLSLTLPLGTARAALHCTLPLALPGRCILLLRRRLPLRIAWRLALPLLLPCI